MTSIDTSRKLKFVAYGLAFLALVYSYRLYAGIDTPRTILPEIGGLFFAIGFIVFLDSLRYRHDKSDFTPRLFTSFAFLAFGSIATFYAFKAIPL